MESTNKKKRYEFDEVFQLVRTMGPYQIILYFGVCMLQFPMAFQFGQSIFALGTPKFHCSDGNSTWCEANKCCNNCTNYVFDGPFTSTVSEWNLLCDRAYLGASIQSSYFAGMLVGSIVSGWIADSFGRRTSIFLSLAFIILFGVGSSFANSIPLLIFLRFFVGFSLAGCMLTQFVYIVEMVGPNKRTHAGKAQGSFWKFGAWAVVLLAYFVRDWRLHILIGSLSGIVFFFFFCVFPETPRWSLAHDHIERAQAVLMKCGAKKNKTLDTQALRELLEYVREDGKQIKDGDFHKRYNPLDLVRTPKLRKWTIIVCYNWFVVSLVYFGFDLYTTQLPGSIYLNYFLMNLIDIPVIGVVWFTVHRYGRKIPYCVYMFVVVVCSFVILGLPKEYEITITTMAILGRSFVWSEFHNIYLITTELYPTVVRNTAMGLGSMTARIGAMLSPYIVMVAQLPGLSLTLPVTIFGVLALIASVVTLWLPETICANMHQTIEEAESAKEDFWASCFRKNRDECKDANIDMPKITPLKSHTEHVTAL
ncbi:organic cation transporter-like protein [Actinia tenebrosa]|uniref:Organic cation transporter-like protein n=1 Tax=Actinia tenebrosa TaxID=6105 RepID=A0A6P8HPX2_ACTTE|nr:organic cation transporter-like protein [Actinia tenebrosa]